MTPILEFQNAGKTFELSGRGGAKLVALADIDLAVEQGQIVGCMGESGCGKSTLARLVVRLETPTTGHVLFHGDDVYEMKGDARKAYPRNVQLVFQDPYSALAPKMSIRDAIEEPLKIHKIGDSQSRRARVAELLELVGMAPKWRRAIPISSAAGNVSGSTSPGRWRWSPIF